jgi:hypothetical protein
MIDDPRASVSSAAAGDDQARVFAHRRCAAPESSAEAEERSFDERAALAARFGLRADRGGGGRPPPRLPSGDGGGEGGRDELVTIKTLVAALEALMRGAVDSDAKAEPIRRPAPEPTPEPTAVAVSDDRLDARTSMILDLVAQVARNHQYRHSLAVDV